MGKDNMKKTFIKLDSLQELIEKQLLEKFRTSKYFSSTIDVRVNLDSIVEEHTKDIPEPKIIMTTDAHYKTKRLVDPFTSEVAWHMGVDRLDDKILESIYPFKGNDKSKVFSTVSIENWNNLTHHSYFQY
jgi:hypothetical protein